MKVLNETREFNSRTQIRYLAAWFRRTPNEIFEPYWRTTAYLIVKHISSEPETAAAIANLFGTTAPKLVLRLQSQAIPELLFNKHFDPIRKIAEYRGDGDEVWLTVMDQSNLASILVFWVQLPQSLTTPEDLMEHLQAFSARLGPATIREVMSVAAIPVLAELFIQLTYRAGHTPDHFANVCFCS